MSKDKRRASCGCREAVLRAFERGYRVDDAGVVYKPDGGVQKLYFGSGGYLAFAIYPECVPLKVHRLAAVQRFGVQAVDEGVVVRHLNHVKTDNSVSNLAIGTARDNEGDNPRESRVTRAQACAAVNRKLTPEQALEVVAMRKEGLTYREIAAEFGVSEGVIGGICRGTLYPGITGIVYRRVRKANPGRQLSEEQVLTIVDEYKAGASRGFLARKYAVSTSTITSVLSGRLYADVTGIRYKSQLKCG